MIQINRNILQYRKQMGYTQDDLAKFLNLTKATISKWENELSYPDIKYLPELANLFDISVDELIGFSPYLEKEQIKKFHNNLVQKINKDNFEEVMTEINQLYKTYMNDFNTVLMLAKVLINHAFLSQDRMNKVFETAINYLDRVILKCKDPNKLQRAIYLKATCFTMLKKHDEIIELLGDRPYKLGEEILLANSYINIGNLNDARKVLQAEIYQQLLILITHLNMIIQYNLSEDIKETIKRAECIIDTFKVNELHPNTALNFNLLSAIYYVEIDKKKAISYLKKYSWNCKSLMKDYYLHGDEFFNLIDDWLNDTPTGIVAPVDKENIKNTMLNILFQIPQFKILEKDQDFKNICYQLKKLIEEESI
ncbi:helix-turn-helix domain-containing protein [Macrococcus capreoli]|uniref:helix-turn-helix domain-containing protein n=1 Tax=Macrococcus capreoli TaxID=2982690 RepID=UPI0021D5FBC9|nr:helix-turn-helix transcriptional regulator [Macrococcus sp. TMW 2.2395]MCU7557683.1 helix-turn-helix domain-containing protein [Macrococcus sp. TMW 2.2395]